MTAYYNENNPFAAAWLRELIKANLIAQGDVDERSIKEVQPEDLRKYTQCHFFAGIGVWCYALRHARWPDDRPVWTGSCPCQPFSAAGKKGGFNDDPPPLARLVQAHPQSVALTQSLGNRLRVKTASIGSTLFRLTWKERITPLGRRICALRASVLRTSGSDSTSWGTSLGLDVAWRTIDDEISGERI